MKTIKSIAPEALCYLLLILAGIQFARVKKTGWEYPDYHHHLFSDMAGYYVYLPAAFIYDFDAEKFPEHALRLSGNGFRYNEDSTRILTKYPCGPAILQAPFFLWVHFNQKMKSAAADGFSSAYQEVPVMAGAFYLFLGMLLLLIFLRKYVSRLAAFLTVFLVGFATHLSYYAFDHPGMSHVFSFFLFSASWLTLQHLMDSGKRSLFSQILLSFFLGLIFITRPVNILVIVFFFFWDFGSGNLKRWKVFLNGRTLFVLLLVGLITISPQLLYWKYAFDSWISYTYQDEGFDHVFLPRLDIIWFAFQNGLFFNSPLWLFMLGGALFMALKRERNGALLFLFFLLLSWITASWHDPYYGCSFGSRPFAEYAVMYSFPLAVMLEKLIFRGWFIRILTVIFCVLLFSHNFKLLWDFEGCWNGRGPWDAREYTRLLLGMPISRSLDFENPKVKSSPDPTQRSQGNHLAFLTAADDASHREVFVPSGRKNYPLKKIRYRFDARFSGPGDTLLVVIDGKLANGKPFWGGNPFSGSDFSANEWHRLSGYMNITEDWDYEYPVEIFFWRTTGDTILVDNLKFWAH